MPKPIRRALLLCLCLGLLGACAAPATSDSQQQPASQRVAAKPAPPMSRPLPGNEVREAPKLDYSCKADADCAVKNVGNCCGAMPACVNKDSPVDPAAVQSQCAKQGMVSACGFRPVSACRCNAGTCESADDGNPLRGPALPAEPTH